MDRERERRAGAEEARTRCGHRARSLPFITEPTAHTTSSPQIRDVLFFFSLPSTLFHTHPGSQSIDLTPAPAPTPTITTSDLDLVLNLGCTNSVRPLPLIARGGIVTATSFIVLVDAVFAYSS